MIVSLDRYRRRRWQFNYSNRPPAQVIRLPVVPRLVPPHNTQEVAAMLDDVERATLFAQQARLVPGLGMKIDLSYRALVVLVGEAEANRQVWAIVDEYLEEHQAA
jgi:hypothetical protein